MRTEQSPDKESLEWEQRLKDEGLPTSAEVDAQTHFSLESDQEEVSEKEAANVSAESDEFGHLEMAMNTAQAEYAQLPEELQQGIIDDIKNMRSKGASFTEVSNRFYQLIEADKKLMALSDENSDTHFTPKPSTEQQKLKKELSKIQVNDVRSVLPVDKGGVVEVGNIDELLKWLEDVRYKGEDKQSGSDNPKQSGNTEQRDWVM